MSAKRKHITLTVEEKLQVVKLIENGKTISQVSQRFGIGRSTVSEIKKNKSKLLAYTTSFEKGIAKRRTLRLSAHPQVEAALYDWFQDERSKGTTLNGHIMREKAKFFHAQMIQKGCFKASSGWFHKFKQRFGIRLNACGPDFDTLNSNIKTEPQSSDEDGDREEYADEIVKEENKVEIVKDLISHSEAVSAFNTCIKWASENNFPLHQIIALEEMRHQVTLTDKFVKVEQNY